MAIINLSARSTSACQKKWHTINKSTEGKLIVDGVGLDIRIDEKSISLLSQSGQVSQDLTISVPYPRNFVRTILPALEHGVIDDTLSDEIVETFVNAKYLGAVSLYSKAIEEIARQVEIVANWKNFQPDCVEYMDLRFILNYFNSSSDQSIEDKLLSRLEILLKWVHKYHEDKEEIKRLFDKFVDFTSCSFTREFGENILWLRKKYPRDFFKYVSIKSLLDLYSREPKYKRYRVSGASVSGVNGEYLETESQFGFYPVYVKKGITVDYAIYFATHWCISSYSDKLSPMQTIENTFYICQQQCQRIPCYGWESCHDATEKMFRIEELRYD